GREREIAEIKMLLGGASNSQLSSRDSQLSTLNPQLPLRDSRLVTLTGTGGVGKTRLAIQVATELRPHFPDGVWFVDLSNFTDPALVPQATAAVFGVQESPGRPILEALAHRLKDKQLLLILDNCEHLVEASRKVADT